MRTTKRRLAAAAVTAALAGGVFAAAAPAQAAYNCYYSYQACFYWNDGASGPIWGTGNQGTAPGPNFNNYHWAGPDHFNTGAQVQVLAQSIYNQAPNGMDAYVYNADWAGGGSGQRDHAYAGQVLTFDSIAWNNNVSWHASYNAG
jgi:hypothetical protein